jgi:hypothetical protein
MSLSCISTFNGPEPPRGTAVAQALEGLARATLIWRGSERYPAMMLPSRRHTGSTSGEWRRSRVPLSSRKPHVRSGDAGAPRYGMWAQAGKDGSSRPHRSHGSVDHPTSIVTLGAGTKAPRTCSPICREGNHTVDDDPAGLEDVSACWKATPLPLLWPTRDRWYRDSR